MYPFYFTNKKSIYWLIFLSSICGILIFAFTSAGETSAAPLLQATATPALSGYESYTDFDGISSDTIDETLASGGYNNIETSTIPPGEIHIVKGASFRYIGTSATSIRLTAKNGEGDWIIMVEETPPQNGKYYNWAGDMLIGPGGSMIAEVFGSTAGDQLKLSYNGYMFNYPAAEAGQASTAQLPEGDLILAHQVTLGDIAIVIALLLLFSVIYIYIVIRTVSQKLP